MKNKKLLIFGVIAVVCIAAVFGIFLTEKKVENAIQEALQDINITCEKVKYSLLSDKIVLTNLAYIQDEEHFKQVTKAQQIEILKPDLDAFNPDTQGRPLVANKIVVYNLEQEMDSKEISLKASLQDLTIDEWYQNIGKAVEAWKKDPNSEEFFAAALDLSIKNFSYSKYHGEIVQDNEKMDWNIASTSGGTIHDGLLSYNVNNLDCSVIPDLHGSFDQMEVADLRIPSPKLMSLLVRMMDFAQSPNAVLEMEKFAEEHLSGLMMEYLTSTPYKKMCLDNVKVSMNENGQDQLVFRLKHLENAMSFSQECNFELGIKELLIPDGLVGLAQELDMVELAVKDFQMDAHFKLNGKPAEPGVVALDVKAKNLASTDCTLAMKMPEKSPTYLDDLPIWITQIDLGKAEVNYIDDGFLQRIVTSMARDTGMSGARFLEEMKEGIKDTLGIVPINGLIEAVDIMLTKPGTLHAEMNPESFMSPMSLGMALMVNSNSLHIKVNAIPGKKELTLP